MGWLDLDAEDPCRLDVCLAGDLRQQPGLLDLELVARNRAARWVPASEG